MKGLEEPKVYQAADTVVEIFLQGSYKHLCVNWVCAN